MGRLMPNSIDPVLSVLLRENLSNMTANTANKNDGPLMESIGYLLNYLTLCTLENVTSFVG